MFVSLALIANSLCTGSESEAIIAASQTQRSKQSKLERETKQASSTYLAAARWWWPGKPRSRRWMRLADRAARSGKHGTRSGSAYLESKEEEKKSTHGMSTQSQPDRNQPSNPTIGWVERPKQAGHRMSRAERRPPGPSNEFDWGRQRDRSINHPTRTYH